MCGQLSISNAQPSQSDIIHEAEGYRHQVRDSYAITRECRHPPPGHHNTNDMKKTTGTSIKEISAAARTCNKSNLSKKLIIKLCLDPCHYDKIAICRELNSINDATQSGNLLLHWRTLALRTYFFTTKNWFLDLKKDSQRVHHSK